MYRHQRCSQHQRHSVSIDIYIDIFIQHKNKYNDSSNLVAKDRHYLHPSSHLPVLFLLGVFPSHHHLITKFNKHFNTSSKKCLISKSSKQTVHQTQIW